MGRFCHSLRVQAAGCSLSKNVLIKLLEQTTSSMDHHGYLDFKPRIDGSDNIWVCLKIG